MKNVLIVLLMAAIGVGIYLYFSHKENSSMSRSEERIKGHWKVDSLEWPQTNDRIASNNFFPFMDSNVRNLEFEFRNDSVIVQTAGRKTADTGHYKLNTADELLI